MNPISGVAVAMATNVPPHNLTEVLNAAVAMLDRPEMTTAELMRYVQGPDFPTGGLVLGDEGIREYLETGKGRFAMRGTVRLEESPRGQALVITEIPFTTKDKIKGSIADAINHRKIDGLMPEIRDESDEDHGLRIVLTLRREANPAEVLNAPLPPHGSPAELHRPDGVPDGPARPGGRRAEAGGHGGDPAPLERPPE